MNRIDADIRNKISVVKRTFSIALCIILTAASLPLTAFSVSVPEGFEKILEKSVCLAPGITQDSVVAYDSYGHRQEYYVATADLNNETVSLETNYKDNQCVSAGTQTVPDQVAAAEANHAEPYSVAASVNGSFFNMSTGFCYSVFVMDGHDATGTELAGIGGGYNFIAVLNDGSIIFDYEGNYPKYKGNIRHAVSGGRIFLKNGNITISPNPDSVAPRTCLGLTADNKVMLLAVDGRGGDERYGLDYYTCAQILKSMGCVSGIELDGGGSTTFYSKMPGDTVGAIRNVPSDGTPRKVASSLMLVSRAESDGVFDHAHLSCDYSYLTPGTTVSVAAKGADSSGAPAPLPENPVWSVSDPSKASVDSNGNVTAAPGASGKFTVSLSFDGVAAGSTELEIVIPDKFAFTKDQMTVQYGSATDFPFKGTYHMEPVAINGSDFFAVNEYEFELKVTEDKFHLYGTFDGTDFIAPDESIGIRNEKLYAISAYSEDENDICSINVSFYKEGEDYFDYDNVTGKEDGLAWRREVSGAYIGSTNEGDYYIRESADSEINIDYTFAFDVSEAKVPDDMTPLWNSFSGALGGTVWSAFLSIANKIDPSSYFMATFDIDDDLTVNGIDRITLKGNEMFYVDSSSVLYDPVANTLAVKCMWNKAYVDSLLGSEGGISDETVRDTVMLSGLSFKPNDEAELGSGEKINIINRFTLSYHFVIFSATAYHAAISNGLEDCAFISTDPDTGEKRYGINFSADYITGNDSFSIQNLTRKGLVRDENGDYYYYSSGSMLSGGSYELTEMNSLAEAGTYLIMDDGRVVLSETDGGLVSFDEFNQAPGTKYAFDAEKYATGAGVGILCEGAMARYTLYIPGDVTCDGDANAMDSVLTRCLAEGMLNADSEAVDAAADFDSNGNISSGDAALMELAGIFTAG